jgi:hypothetical protein
MAQALTVVSSLAGIVVALWWLRRPTPSDGLVYVTIHLDSSMPGAHLIWEVVNTGDIPITLANVVIHPRRLGEGRGESTGIVPLSDQKTLECGDRAQLSMDVDWRLLDARSIAAVDDVGHEHAASSAQLTSVQDQLRELIDRRSFDASAIDWLSGAASLAFGAVILGLGFFMLMWVIATG